MSGVTLTVHRSAKEIGGNCIEIASVSGERLILDVGRPLDAPEGAVDLLPETLDRQRPATVLISHPHQDHYGLLEEIPEGWPVYAGEATEKLIRLTAAIRGKTVGCRFNHWRPGQPNRIHVFTITPFVTDHSAFDAHMLLIEVDGRRFFYSGDFRRHGRKAALVERLMATPPREIDVLLMEGTNLGSNKSTMAEADLEKEFVELFQETPGRVFVAWSAQNIDRTVTLYRAALKAGRTLVVDLYTAEVMELLGEHGRLPQPDWRGVKVVVTGALSRMYRRTDREELVARMARNGIPARALADTPAKWVSMIRPSLIRDLDRAGVIPNRHDAWSWSMWEGYLASEDGQRLQTWFDAGGASARHIHTSGHASPADLRAFAAALAPKKMVPIHGVAWDEDATGFPPIRRLRDGEPMVL